MPSLDVVQRAFANEIWHDESTDLTGLIVGDAISAQRRLNIYRNNVSANLCLALAATYPVIQKLLGSEFFQNLADAYAIKHPSRCGDLRYFGRDLPDFLANLATVRSLPYLRDVARLEWACRCVSEAEIPALSAAVNVETFAPDDIANLGFRFHQTSRLVRSTYPVFTIWRVNQETHTGDKSVNLDDGAQSVLVVRPDAKLELWPLDEAEAVFAAALLEGHSLAEAVDAVISCGQDVELQPLLGKYLSKGTLALLTSGHASTEFARRTMLCSRSPLDDASW